MFCLTGRVMFFSQVNPTKSFYVYGTPKKFIEAQKLFQLLDYKPDQIICKLASSKPIDGQVFP